MRETAAKLPVTKKFLPLTKKSKPFGTIFVNNEKTFLPEESSGTC